MTRAHALRVRGFALLLVMVIAVAMVAVASALTMSAGHLSVASVKSEGAETARMIAESGLARAEAWASEVIVGKADFDEVLDPDFGNANGADCTGLPGSVFNVRTSGSAPKAGPTTFMPKFTDGSIVQFPSGSGKRWYQVTFGRGAYLVRFEDNQDDLAAAGGAAWASRTDNTVGTGCVEGQDADNPARDRDGAIWLHVLGIAPGTNAGTADHRVMVRKLLRTPAGIPGGAALFANGNIEDGVVGKNSVGSVAISGNVTQNNPFCGLVEANGTNTSTAGAPADCGSNTHSAVAAAGVPAVVVPTPTDAAWYDWTKPCTFYARPGAGLFYWDAAATRGGVDCDTYIGPLVPPNPDPTQPPANGSCWTPIMLQSDESSSQDPVLPYDPFEDPSTDQVSRSAYEAQGCAGFAPKSDPNPNYTDPGGGYAANNHTPGDQDNTFKSWFTTSTAVTVPDWTQCNGVTWGDTPGVGGPLVSNLTGATLLFCKDSGYAYNSDSALQFLGGSPGAYVPGVIFKEGNFRQIDDMGSPPTTLDNNPKVWPMVTLAVQGVFRADGNADFWIGSGRSAGGLYPSVISAGDLDVGTGTASARFAGAVYVAGNILAKKTVVLFGPVYTAGNLKADPGGSIVWDYNFDFLGSGTATAGGPQPLLTFPVGF